MEQHILNNVKNGGKILEMVKKTKIDKEYYLNHIENEWNKDTLFYIKNNKLNEKKTKEYELMENKERFLLGRTIDKYINNLIEGWLIEDMIIIILREKGYSVIKKGNDSERELLFTDNFNLYNLDLEVENINIDIMSDNTGYCKRNNSISLAYAKKLKFMENDCLIIFDNENKKIGIIQPHYHHANKVIINEEKKIFKYEMIFNYETVFYDPEELKGDSRFYRFIGAINNL